MDEKKDKKNISANGVKTYFIPLSEASKISGYTTEHLNLLCRKKILKGMKIGRNWHTTQEWLNEFLFLPEVGELGDKKYKRRKNTTIKPAKRFFEEQSLPDSENVPEPVSNLLDERIKNLEEESQRLGRENKKAKWIGPFKFTLASFFIFILLFFTISFWQYLITRNDLSKLGISDSVPEDTFIADNKNGIVAGEETVATDNNSESSSENYVARQISLGGVNVALAGADNVSLEVSDIKSQSFVSKDGKDVQTLISWKTNKLAISEIDYAQDGYQNPSALTENSYGFNHNVILTKLETGAIYGYVIKSKDHWGNEISSEEFRAYTGSKIISVFELILKALNDTFSWAVKK